MVTVENPFIASADVSAGRDEGKDIQENGFFSMSRYLISCSGETKKYPSEVNFSSAPSLISDDGDSSDYDSDVSETSCADECRNKIIEAAEKVRKDMKQYEDKPSQATELTESQFKLERRQLMTIIVKYISSRIAKVYPPNEDDNSRKPSSIEKFLLVLCYKLRLSMTHFIKATIYLFRYMDTVYLMRYLNQSNNFSSYECMDFSLNKLILGCFKLAMDRENIRTDWDSVTVLKKEEISSISNTLVTRMNGKLLIKSSELKKFRLEIFRFVRLVTNPI